MTARVLVVCTGNVARSPFAERLLRARFAELGVDATVSSAGTRALVGKPMTEEAASIVDRLGAFSAAHVARQLDVVQLQETDLVLTATRAHRAEVASMLPRMARKAYTLREFARIAEFLASEPEGDLASIDGRGAGGLLEAVSSSRGFAPPPEDPESDDIVDPYRRSEAVYEEAGRLIDSATAVIAASFAAAERPGRGAA